MIVFRTLCGQDEPGQGASEALSIDCFQAYRNRFSVALGTGASAFVDLPDGSYLAHGSLLFSDEQSVVRVERTPEPAFIFELGAGAAIDHAEIVFSLSHRLGNLHLPAEYVGGQIRGPLSVGRDTLERIADFYSGRVTLRFDVRPLGLDRPLHGIRGGHR